jgi:uncharacterized protein YjbI with pentapeptide repeats
MIDRIGPQFPVEYIAHHLVPTGGEAMTDTPRDNDRSVSLMDRYRNVRRGIWNALDRAASWSQGSWKSRREAIGWTLLVVAAAGMLILPVVRLAFSVVDVAVRWLVTILAAIVGDRGYLTAGSIAAAYLAIYGLVDAKHLREENQASLERSTFVTLVSAGEPANFVTALKTFGPIQTRMATKPPSWLEFWTWGQKEDPNGPFMHQWALDRFKRCRSGICSLDKDIRIDLSGANLTGANLWNVDLSGADLRGAHLAGADLHEANLNRATLAEAVLAQAKLSKARMSEANLRGADLRASDLAEAWLDHADLSDKSATFEGARGAPVNMSNANLAKAYLENANMHKAKLTDANLAGANLNGANLDGADLSGATLAGARYNAGTIFPIGFDPVEAGVELDRSLSGQISN